jgi:trehalose 6-phosphate phosphatase
VDQLGAVEGPLILSGLYGLEEAQRPPAGEWQVEERPEAANWRTVVGEAADRADRDLPAEVFVERKGLSVTLHWRRHPELASSISEWAERAAAETGLAVHAAKASMELRPPVHRDKGTVVEELAAAYDSACFVGDDVGDLPAFAALGRLGGGTVGVAVASPEVDARVVAAADVVVDGPEATLEFLRQLV